MQLSNMPAVLPLPPNLNTIISLLDNSTTLPELHQIHAQIIKSNLATHNAAVTRLIRLSALTQSPQQTISFYAQMLQYSDDLTGLQYSIPSLLKACGSSQAFKEGRQIHAQVLKTHFHLDPFVTNSLLRMYPQSGQVETAKQVFDKMPVRDAISWNSMLAGSFKSGDTELAKMVFDEMPHKDLVSWNTMIDGFMKCGRWDLASDLFEKVGGRGDVVTWTSMISGLVLNSRPNEALEMFHKMLVSGIHPDVAAIVSVLSAIADMGFPDEGKWVHAYVCRSNIELSKGALASALIDMYSKCGLISDARSVFSSVCNRKRVGDWNSMITGLAFHGIGHQALEMYNEMRRRGVEPNEITFLAILNACSHSGLVEEGRYYFNHMHEKYEIEPKIQHYGCLIDLLGRAGLVEEALSVMERLPMEPDSVAWKSLLSACVKHNHLAIGELAAMKAIEIAPEESSCYVMLSNIYAKFGQYDEVEGVRRLMRQRGVRKIAGCSRVMIDGRMHEFIAGKEMGVSRAAEVVCKLKEVVCRLKREGYEPDLTQVLVDVEEEEKEDLLNVHSEKLAIAFGLLKLGKGAPIHIVKNLRVCGDCHSFSKLVSRVYSHEIILRDQNRFHHCKEGACSCNDYW